ncbi:MAG: hypothetical protein LUO86_04950 [Methanomicrobiales archaeon]|nr:hypothetical protein [Methanomicrobiales archaeon]
MARIIPELGISDLYLFSLFAGDTSHIRRIAEIARMHGMRVHAVLPEGSRSGFLEYTLHHAGVDDFVGAA